MGTNYYFRYNKCSCCNRYDELHIGKSSYGWEFSFHAIDQLFDMKKLDPKHMLANTEEQRLVINTYKQWKSFINKYVIELEVAEIVDEYDSTIHPSEFYDMIKRKKGGRNHVDYLASEEYRFSHDPKLDFKDNDGNSFSLGEFS